MAPEIFVPLFIHWYVGVPPLVGVAVNVTLVPEQMVPLGLAAILTLEAKDDETTMVMLLEVAGFPEGQVTVLVSVQVIISPLTNDDEVYVVVVAPEILPPFFFH